MPSFPGACDFTARNSDRQEIEGTETFRAALIAVRCKGSRGCLLPSVKSHIDLRRVMFCHLIHACKHDACVQNDGCNTGGWS